MDVVLAKDNVGGTAMTVEGLADGSFNVLWFDTWTSQIIKTDSATSAGGKLSLRPPASPMRIATSR